MAKQINPNIAGDLDEQDRRDLVSKLLRQIEGDLTDRAEWEEKQETWYRLWACDPGARELPFEGAANVCLPILTSACEMFHERTHTGVIVLQGDELFEALPTAANDVEKAKRQTKLLNWRTRSSMTEFEPETDVQLTELPICGTNFTKIDFDPDMDRPVKEFVSGVDCIVPYDAKRYQMSTCRRATHRFSMHPDDIEDCIEKEDFFADENAQEKRAADDARARGERGYPEQATETIIQPLRDASDEITGIQAQSEDSETHTMYECHFIARVQGVDEEYKDNRHWIALIDSGTERLLSLRSRKYGKEIVNHWQDYHLIPNPHGFYSFGWGHMIQMLLEIANAIFNQYIDAGRISNQPFFFYQPTAGFKRKMEKLTPGKGIEVRDINGIRMEKLPGLDGTLAELLMFVDRYAQDVTSNTEEVRGRTQKGVREPTARGQNSRVDEALVGVSAKMQRFLLSLSGEGKIIMQMERLFTSEDIQHRVLGSTRKLAFSSVTPDDIATEMDITIKALPGMSSRAAMRREAVELLQTMLQNPIVVGAEGGQGANLPLLSEITRQFLATFGHGELARFILDTERTPMDPGEEEMAWIEGEEVHAPVQGENHAEHIAAHEELLGVGEMDDELRADIAAHVEMHMIFAQAAVREGQQTNIPQEANAA